MLITLQANEKDAIKVNPPCIQNIPTLVWAAPNSLQNWGVLFDIYCLSSRRKRGCTSVITCLNSPLAHNSVYLAENFSKSIFYICCIQCRSFHEVEGLSLWKWFSILCWNGHKVSKIWLVANQHDHDVRVCVLPQLLQPPSDILKRCMPSDIIHQQSTNSTSVVSTSNSTVPAK